MLLVSKNNFNLKALEQNQNLHKSWWFQNTIIILVVESTARKVTQEAIYTLITIQIISLSSP